MSEQLFKALQEYRKQQLPPTPMECIQRHLKSMGDWDEFEINNSNYQYTEDGDMFFEALISRDQYIDGIPTRKRETKRLEVRIQIFDS